MERTERTVYCPKCNSDEVEIIALNKPEPGKISMDDLDEYFRTPKPVTAVLKYVKYRAVCKHCNYVKDFMASGGM